MPKLAEKENLLRLIFAVLRDYFYAIFETNRIRIYRFDDAQTIPNQEFSEILKKAKKAKKSKEKCRQNDPITHDNLLFWTVLRKH